MFIEEKELRNYPNVISFECTEKILEQMRNKICNIKLIDGTLGTGFFCKIPFPTKDKMLPILVTNNHLIDEKILENKNELIMLYTKDSNKYQNFILNNRKYYTNKEYDITFIEIKENYDEIYNYLELDDNILDSIVNNIPISQDSSNNYYIGETIYIMQYPEGKLSVSYGIVEKITDEQKYNFNHLCSTKKGSSGSPILNISNNKVFGIHKKSSVKSNFNKGTFLNIPIKEFIMQSFNIKLSEPKPKKEIVQREVKEDKKINKIKEVKEDKDINKIKEDKVDKELKSMTLKEFNEKFNLDCKPDIFDLNLGGRKCGNDILEIIANLQLNNLRNLCLTSNKISNIDMLSKFQCQKLEKFILTSNYISDISVFQYVKFPQLKILFLDENKISDISVFEKVNFENLVNLNLNSNIISDIDVLERVKFPKIENLYFWGNKISDISVFERVKFPKLFSVHLFKNNIDKESFSSLIDKLKNNIKYFYL